MNNRLQSLDVLRGFTLFMLLFFGPVATTLLHTIDASWCAPILYQLEHEPWEGFRFWDLLMPQFLFMAGASMPFSFEKYRTEGHTKEVWCRIGKRVFWLFLFGMVVQGNLLAFDHSHTLRLYSNTLQAIACGYVIAALILLNFKWKGQIICTIALLLVYWIPLTFCGDFTCEGNFAEKVDCLVLGRFRDGVYWDADGWHFADWYRYTWIWSSLTFGATTMLGCLSTQLLRWGQKQASQTALRLFLIGLGLVLVGWVWSFQMPIIKHIWTSTMVLHAGGLSMMFLAFFYYLIDCRGWRKGWTWLEVYGTNSIVAYVVGERIDFGSVVRSVSYGLEQFLGSYYGVWLTFGNFAILFLILWFLHRQRIFLRV